MTILEQASSNRTVGHVIVGAAKGERRWAKTKNMSSWIPCTNFVSNCLSRILSTHSSNLTVVSLA